LGKVLEDDEGDIEDVVGEVESEKEVEGKGDFANLAVGSFHIEEFLDSLPINNHLSDVLVLVLNGQVKRQLSAVVLYVTVAPTHQQLLHDPPIARHHCQVQRSHPIGKVLLINLSAPG
jgi:hypothetical protein